VRDHNEIADRLCDEVHVARAAFQQACELLRDVTRDVTTDIPKGLPGPDIVLRIQQATAEHGEARLELMKALDRLNHFVLYDTIPDDLK
jgi:hypothetical protein